MAPSVSTAMGVSHRFLLEKPFRDQAKADLKEFEIPEWRAAFGRCIDRARQLCGWSKKELAAKLGDRDMGQVSRWIDGKERAHMDVLLSVDEFRGPLVIALAEITREVKVETTITLRRHL